MTSFVDTNVLVRHLTGDPSSLAARATAFLAGESELYLADLIVAETIYVLESFYKAPCVQVANAGSTGIGRVASFDQTIDRVTTVERIEP